MLRHRVGLLLLASSLVAIVADGAGAQRGPGTNGVIWPPSQPPALVDIPQGEARLTGRVLDRETRMPLPNATVTLRLLPSGSGPQNAGLVLVTNEVGEFTVRNITVGRYTVDAVASGRTRRLRLAGLVPTELVTLSATRPDASVTLLMSKTAEISGRVLDESGSPVAAVPVRVLRQVFVSPRLIWQPIPTISITGADGLFRFTDAPPGDYVVGAYYRTVTVPAPVSAVLWNRTSPAEAEALRARLAESAATYFATPLSSGSVDVDGYRFSVFDALSRPSPSETLTADGPIARASYAGATGVSVTSAEPISLDPGERRSDVVIVLRKANGVRVSGVLTGEKAHTAHVSLRLMPADEYELMETFPQELATTISDAQGRFAFYGVPPGRASIVSTINVLTSPPGALPRRSTVAWARQAIDVGTSDIDGLTVPVNPTGVLRGSVALDAGTSAPVDAYPPLAILRLSRSTASAQAPVVTPGESPGSFVFTNLVGGRYTFEIQPWNGWVARSITIGGRETLNRSFEIAGPHADDVVVTMIRSAARLTGAVMDQQGAPLDGAQVVLFPADPADWIAKGRSPGVLRSSLSSGGRYVLNGLQPGDYRLVAFAASVGDDWQTASSLDALAAIAQPVRIGTQPISMDVRVVLPGLPKRRR